MWAMSRRVVEGAITASPRCTVRIAASSSSGGASLSRNPLAPASIASNAYSSRSKVVSTTTRGASGRCSSVRVASMPSISGMRTSMSTTSAPATDTDATASRPLPASATTVRSGWESTSMASPERIRAWSSTRATRTGAFSASVLMPRIISSGRAGRGAVVVGRPAQRGAPSSRGRAGPGALLPGSAGSTWQYCARPRRTAGRTAGCTTGPAPYTAEYGRCADTRYPAPARGPVSTVPPNRATRSATPRSP